MTIRWDELRFFLAVAREGTIAGAARSLNVNDSTVARRLNELEKDLEGRLFDRLPSGYQLTEKGQQALPIAARIERDVAALELEVLGSDGELSGPLRITVPEHLSTFTVDEMAAFTAVYPEIVPELIISDELLDLYRRQSDVAIRITQRPPGSLVGRRIAHYVTATYASRRYVASHDLQRPETLAWLGIRHGEHNPPSWATRVAPGARMASAIDRLTPTVQAIRRDMGLGHLPCFLGDADPDLVRVDDPRISGFGIWLLTHESLRSTRRVRVFTDHLAQAMLAQKDLFEGRAPAHQGHHGEGRADASGPPGVGHGVSRRDEGNE